MERYAIWPYASSGRDRYAIVFDKTKIIKDGFNTEAEAEAYLKERFQDLERKRLNPPKKRKH